MGLKNNMLMHGAFPTAAAPVNDEMSDVHASPFLSCAFECDYKNLKDKTGTAGYIGKSF